MFSIEWLQDPRIIEVIDGVLRASGGYQEVTKALKEEGAEREQNVDWLDAASVRAAIHHQVVRGEKGGELIRATVAAAECLMQPLNPDEQRAFDRAADELKQRKIEYTSVSTDDRRRPVVEAIQAARDVRFGVPRIRELILRQQLTRAGSS